jgi:hypothetical protein
MKATVDMVGISFMKTLPILAAILAAASITSAAGTSFDDITLHYSKNAQIIWKAPTNVVPKRLWVYKIFPNTFTEPVISNAVVLASYSLIGTTAPDFKKVEFS